ncbi:hypothetical protein BOTBODRAFT_135803 [Botryobasidium botryosum FD-172 SS1]|uniref:Altered inheritance of mitochondria protein 9, mitochondrial n=1 Tax=Botryobasidium botryosum (strain FD-172 SS1) TaxID=930990 RepID=A0A067MIW4_BOTB1|nr:hypothetical protein BOTBODRAFT_135803 [Botryobasidium botryosum FD-172 SS1]
MLHYVEFDAAALQKIASEAAGAKSCLSIRKIAEGAFNKIFLLRLDNNKEVIARIPCSSAGPPHFATASEVATMDFALDHLHLPVPKVLAWSSRLVGNPVGAEYIIMEYMPGVPLEQRWLGMTGDEAISLIENVVRMEKRYTEFQFSQIGSLYFKEDVDPELQGRRLYANGAPDDEASEKYRIGPTLQWDFWREEWLTMNVDRGPWPDLQSYGHAIFRCEQQWLGAYARSHSLYDPLCWSSEERPPDPEAHLEMLDRFLSVIPLLNIPSELLRSTFWYTGLQKSNVMVAPTGYPEITGLLDWKNLWIGPRFIQAVFAPLFIYDGDMVDLHGLPPDLPDNFEELSDEEKAKIKTHIKLACQHKVYEYTMEEHDPEHFRVLTYRHYGTIANLFQNASRIWLDGVSPLRQSLIETAAHWKEMAGPDIPCPLTFSKEELASHSKLHDKALAREA